MTLPVYHVLTSDELALWCGAPIPRLPATFVRSAGDALFRELIRRGEEPEYTVCPACMEAISAFYSDDEE